MAVKLAPPEGPNAALDAEEFLRRAERGEFGSQPVELIDGKVYHVSGQDHLHFFAVGLAMRAFLTIEPEGFATLTQGSVRIGGFNVPEPDLFVIRGSYRDSKAISSESLAFVLEVSVSTLRYDRIEKAALYAGAGIPEYWLINPSARQVEVRRSPKLGEYSEVILLGETDSLATLFAPDRPIAALDLLPNS